MKNKEIEELLNMLKKCAREDKATLKLNEIACKTILSYIEQLENNRDKAYEFVKEKRKVFEWYDTDLFYLESLLKGDSDE